MTDPINQEHEEVLNFAHSLPSGLTQEQIYVRIHERARAEILGIYHSAGARHVEETNALHRRLAAETLRADQGWKRYEAANADRNSLRGALPADPVDESQPAAQWISVNERMPSEWEMVLTWGSKRVDQAVMAWNARDGWQIETANEWHAAYTPTHWRKLPAAPAMEAQSHE